LIEKRPVSKKKDACGKGLSGKEGEKVEKNLV
jgi:hypothetical protein